jgi:predicted small lipoprotein YifL
MIQEGLLMKHLLLAFVALAGFSLAACEEKNPVEKAADEIEDVVDEAN